MFLLLITQFIFSILSEQVSPIDFMIYMNNIIIHKFIKELCIAQDQMIFLNSFPNKVDFSN